MYGKLLKIDQNDTNGELTHTKNRAASYNDIKSQTDGLNYSVILIIMVNCQYAPNKTSNDVRSKQNKKPIIFWLTMARNEIFV